MDILNIIIHWLVASGAFLVTAYLLPGVTVASFSTAVIAAGLLGIINAVIRPILVFLTLPITVVTFGLFLFVINALIILGLSEIVDGFSVANFWWALLFSIILSLINAFFLSIVY
ncbi:MAG: phage holin family protein [Candidatus Altimarinota bacterium]